MVGLVESNWSFRPFEIFGSSRSNHVDLPSGKLLLPLGLIRIRPSVYHVELMFWVREHWAACLGAGVPVRPVLIAHWTFRMLLHVVFQGIAILCRVFPFGVEEASGFHYLSEVVRARRPRWSATLSSRHQVIALALLSLWFGGLRIVLPLVLVWPIVVLDGHRLLLAGIPVGCVEEVFYRFRWSSCQLLEQVGIPDPCPERGHDDWVAGAQDGVLLLHEPPDVVPEGFVFLLCDLIEIPLNPRFCERPLVVVDELGAEISLGIDRIRWKSRKPILYGRK